MNPLETKPDKKNPVQAETQTISVVSEVDRAILERVKSQPASLDEINEIRVEKKDDGLHRLSLPEELKKYEKKYAFCWVFKRPRAIDEACQQYHWLLCNRTYFPDVPNFHFSVSGIIERGDNVLLFRPKHIEDEMRRQPGLESVEKIKGKIGAHANDPSFYTPTSEEYEIGPDGKKRKVPVVGL